jgi:hypothetical protein
MLDQKITAGCLALVFIIPGAIIWYATNDIQISRMLIFAGISIGVGMLTWQYNAPDYAYMLFRVQVPKSSHILLLSTTILFAELILGFWGMLIIISDGKFRWLDPSNLWVVGFCLLVSLIMAFRNRRFYK